MASESAAPPPPPNTHGTQARELTEDGNFARSENGTYATLEKRVKMGRRT